MAKRTNKTDHVLNLLSSGSKSGEPDSEKKETAAPPVDPEPKKAPEPEAPAKTANKVSNVSVVHMSASDENPIADSVKDSLEEELDAYLQQKEEAKDSAELPSEPEQVEEPAETEEPSSKNGDPEITAEESEISIPEQEEEEAAETDAAAPQPEEEKTPEPQAVQAEPEESASEPEPSEEAEELDFEPINVMEHLVRRSALEYMTQFGNCTCARCVEDTVALTLTHLPAKYVVVNKSAVSPLLNFYEKKYAGQLIVEITKSCMTVKEFPHH